MTMEKRDFVKRGQRILEISDYLEKKPLFLQWKEELFAFYATENEAAARELKLKTH